MGGTYSLLSQVRSLGAFSDDKGSQETTVSVLPVGVSENLNQIVNHFGEWLPVCRDAIIWIVSLRNVIKPGDGYVSRHRETERISDCVGRSHRERIILTHEYIWQIFPGTILQRFGDNPSCQCRVISTHRDQARLASRV
jgi:hypothetical protein